MVTCPNCKSNVQEGKFCENCGALLPGATGGPQNYMPNVCPNCGTPYSGGKFCERCGALLDMSAAQGPKIKTNSFIDNISNQINKTASSILAIKSDFNNGNIIYKVNKIPNVKEKTIKVENYEVVFFNSGTGFMKYDQSFQTELNSFLCAYVKKVTFINNNFSVLTQSRIKKLNTEDLLNVKIDFSLALVVEDVEKFFNVFMNLRQDTWTEMAVNNYLSTNLKSIINQQTIDMLQNDDNLDLRDPNSQINSFLPEIQKYIEKEVGQYGIKVNAFILKGVFYDVNELNRILIKNLYTNE